MARKEFPELARSVATWWRSVGLAPRSIDLVDGLAVTASTPVVGSFVHRGVSAAGALCRTVVVARFDRHDLTGSTGLTGAAALARARVAVDSPSGLHGGVGLGLVLDRPFVGELVVTGSHRASLDAVISGDAEAAAVDPYRFVLAGRARMALIGGIDGRNTVDGVSTVDSVDAIGTASDLIVIARGPLVPGTALVLTPDPTRADEAGPGHADVEAVRSLVRAALADTEAAVVEARDDLLLDGFEPLDAIDYLHLPGLARRALAQLPPPAVRPNRTRPP